LSATEYQEFIAKKLTRDPPTGIRGATVGTKHLFPFQGDLTSWALRRGRAALFEATGLGKTRQQLTWADAVARHLGRPVIILAPLAVASQTSEEAEKIGIMAAVARDHRDIDSAGIWITNYERLHRFETSVFGGVVLDESSIIKHHEAKTLAMLIEAFSETPFRLCCTATPSPNDYTELGNHAEFLGICTRAEMLSEFFCHDGGETQTWRLKGHARQAFWRFVASWGALVRSPADLGYDAGSYNLPPLRIHNHVVPATEDDIRESGLLFAVAAESLMDRRAARRGSIDSRIARCSDLINADQESWVVFCELNAESEMLAKQIHGAIEVTGSMDTDAKEAAIFDFIHGKARVLVTKGSIAGFGLNLQHCARMAFVGVSDSWELMHQCKARIWRFGQKRECHVHIFASELEGNVSSQLGTQGAGRSNDGR
jgi:hypothetical protein